MYFFLYCDESPGNNAKVGFSLLSLRNHLGRMPDPGGRGYLAKVRILDGASVFGGSTMGTAQFREVPSSIHSPAILLSQGYPPHEIGGPSSSRGPPESAREIQNNSIRLRPQCIG